mmetsp:Transcript_19965/g.41315  ORF Transcript_19965/g.41315 Transcript_19965/m.41315 type:complete len:82 (+) Transcript_19965:1598-1843(+)
MLSIPTVPRHHHLSSAAKARKTGLRKHVYHDRSTIYTIDNAIGNTIVNDITNGNASREYNHRRSVSPNCPRRYKRIPFSHT